MPAVLIGVHGAVALANEAFVALLERERVDVHGKAFVDLVHPEDRAKVSSLLVAARHQPVRQGAQVRLLGAGPAIIHAEVVAAPLASPEEADAAMYVQVVDRRRQRSREEELEALALTDELTGLSNRRGFAAAATQLLEFARRERRTLTFFFVDIEGLKAINDRHGHAAGDEAIRRAGRVLGEVFRTADAVGRYGGDEFCVLGVTRGLASAEELRARLDVAMAAQPANLPFRLSLSVGLVHRPAPEVESLEMLIAEVDHAMCAQRHRCQ